MSNIIWLSIGFAFGGVTIGLGISGQIDKCIVEHNAPCTIEQTWSGAKIRPLPTP